MTTRAGTGTLAALAVGGLITAAACGAGLTGLFSLAVIMNGFTERQAQPWFIGFLVVLSGGHAALVALASWLIVRGRQARPWLFVTLATLGYTVLPYLLVAAYALVPWLRRAAG